MLMQEIILKKRNALELSTEEINFFVEHYTAGDIPDYQAAALLMAVWFRGMNERETANLTMAIRDSGEIVALEAIEGITVDKHSTGGVADTTTLISAPLVAACGARVAKISGRGLGHTGGTVDKLEAIPGLDPVTTVAEFVGLVSACGLAITSQSPNLVPADKKLYALRDVTGTVDNVSLISSSIMSKKLASGAGAIVLDVKVGNGAFIEDVDKARELALMMVAIGKRAGKPTTALITDMNQPLGMAVGNALEVEEAIGVLQGTVSGDLKMVSLALAAEMLLVSGLAESDAEAAAKLDDALKSGEGLRRLEQMIDLLGGDPRVCSNPSLLPRAKQVVTVQAPTSGFVSHLETTGIGVAAQLLGAGRATKEDRIDPAVGLQLRVRLGDRVERGQELGQLWVNDTRNLDRAVDQLRRSITVSEEPAVIPPLIADRIREVEAG